VKISATKKAVGLELGVVTVRVSPELRVPLRRMVEQDVFEFLGRMNHVIP
jgi:phosphoglycolate phosphatase-like HAD superfamily hydrolase